MFPNSFYPMPAVSFKSKPNNFYHLIAYESITITPKKIRGGVLYKEKTKQNKSSIIAFLVFKFSCLSIRKQYTIFYDNKILLKIKTKIHCKSEFKS